MASCLSGSLDAIGFDRRDFEAFGGDVERVSRRERGKLFRDVIQIIRGVDLCRRVDFFRNSLQHLSFPQPDLSRGIRMSES